jgi:predicted house-cleaning noncanonical NTP pyrophosphatase (MazG superfamily)
MTEKQLLTFFSPQLFSRYRGMIHDKIMYIINSDNAIKKLNKKEQLKFKARIHAYLIEEQAQFIDQLFKLLKH